VLKVPERKIFDRSDFHYFYIINSLCGGGGGCFGIKINFLYIMLRCSFRAAKFLTRMLRIISLVCGKKNFVELLRPFISVNKFYYFCCFRHLP
jgi:hypothetical protein